MSVESDPRAFFEAIKRERREHPWRWWWQRQVSRMQRVLIHYLDSYSSILWRYTLGRWLFIKDYGAYKDFAVALEVENLRFVRGNTTIPVPRPLLSFRWPPLCKMRATYLLMTKVPGETLQSAWPSLSEETKAAVIAQLATYVAQLRALRSPHGATTICSVSGGPFYCIRTNASHLRGPFADEAELNACLRGRYSFEDLHPSIAEAHARTHLPITFTHGDLVPRNIMYHEGRISAIIDWENAGWFPAHWEYIKTRFGILGMYEQWVPWIERYMDIYPEEARADAHLSSVAWYPI